jgi:hypothetical protein
MRLPWPFQRARHTGGTSTPATGRRPSPVERAAPPRGAEAWRSLPALAETIGPPPLVAPVRPFAAALAGENPPPPILAPLSHGIGLEAPRGLIVGVARPIPAIVGNGSTSVVQRAPARRGVGATLGDAGESFDPVAAGADLEVAQASLIPTVSAAVDPAPVPATVWGRGRLPISDAAVGRVARSLSRSGGRVAIKAPPVGVVREARSAPTPASSAAAIQRAPLASPPAVASTPPIVPSPPTTASAAPMSHPAISTASAGRLTIGQARRLGLGAPVAGGPVTMGPPDAGPRTLARIAPPPPEVSPLAVSPLAVSPLAIAIPPTATVPAPSVPDVPTSAQLAHPVTVRATALAPGRPSPWPAAEGSKAPTLAARPLQTGVQRAPLTTVRHPGEEAEGAGKLGPAGASGAPSSVEGTVTVHRGAAASDLSTALQARAFTSSGEIYLPASHGPLNAGPAKSLLAHELTHVAQQRRLGSSLPTEASPHGGALEAEAVAAESSGSLPLAAPPRPTKHEDAAGPLAAAGAQRAPIAAAARTGDPSAPPADITETVRLSMGAQRAPMESASRRGTHANELAGKGQRTEQELEDLAGQLYARIGSRLRRELLVDRERAGLVMDRS